MVEEILKNYKMLGNISLFKARESKRRRMGLPEWNSVQNWMAKDRVAPMPRERVEKKGTLENSKIPILSRYDTPADTKF